MIDIFEIETLIAKDKDNKYNTVCVNLEDYQDLKQYIVKGRIKGYYIAGFNLIESGAAILGKSPIHETNE